MHPSISSIPGHLGLREVREGLFRRGGRKGWAINYSRSPNTAETGTVFASKLNSGWRKCQYNTKFHDVPYPCNCMRASLFAIRTTPRRAATFDHFLSFGRGGEGVVHVQLHFLNSSFSQKENKFQGSSPSTNRPISATQPPSHSPTRMKGTPKAGFKTHSDSRSWKQPLISSDPGKTSEQPTKAKGDTAFGPVLVVPWTMAKSEKAAGRQTFFWAARFQIPC